MDQIDNDFLKSLKKIDTRNSLLLLKHSNVHEKISLLICLCDGNLIPNYLIIRSKMPGNLITSRTAIENLLKLEQDENVISYSISMLNGTIFNSK